MLGQGETAPMLTAQPSLALGWIAALTLIALLAPNTQQIMGHPWIKERERFAWTPRPVWAIALGCLFGIAVAGTFGRETAFLYFRF
jgi:hypothetical protein